MSIFGHPLHPMLVPLPIGAFVFGVIALLLFTVSGDPFWLQGSYWLAIAGVVTASAAAVAGFMDWLGIPGDSRNRNIGAWHLALNLTLVGLFFVSWLILGGFGGATGANATFALVLQVVGALMLGVSGWLGGEMVFGKPEEDQKPTEQPKQEQQSGQPAT